MTFCLYTFTSIMCRSSLSSSSLRRKMENEDDHCAHLCKQTQTNKQTQRNKHKQTNKRKQKNKHKQISPVLHAHLRSRLLQLPPCNLPESVDPIAFQLVFFFYFNIFSSSFFSFFFFFLLPGRSSFRPSPAAVPPAVVVHDLPTGPWREMSNSSHFLHNFKLFHLLTCSSHWQAPHQ